jgi:hypothetical protein
MSRLSKDLPDRLITGEATDFERRVIDAALEQRPSAAASARMAKALGVTVTTVGTAAAAKALAAEATAKGTAAAASTAWPWISVGVLGLVVGGAVVGVRARHETSPVLAPALPTLTAPAVPAPGTRAPAEPAADVLAPAPATAKPAHRRSHTTPLGGDLHDEIAVVDAARAAVAGGDAPRALEILRGYDTKYGSGSFRPEAAAIKIEALVKLGRQREARELATKLMTEQRGTLLASRVAELVGLSDSAASP